MNRKEVYRRYAQSAGIKTLATILHHQDKISDGVLEVTLHKLNELTHQAMREAGVKFNEFGQVSFADGIYFDFTMPIDTKIALLASCDGKTLEEITEMIEELKQFKEFAK